MLTTEDVKNATEDTDIRLETAPYDPRFPNTNQNKNCWQNYVDFHKCQRAMGEDYEPCFRFKRIYNILCPSFWVLKFAILFSSIYSLVGGELG